MLLWVHQALRSPNVTVSSQALRSPNVTVSSPGTEVSKCSLHFFLLLLCLCWFIRFVRQSSLPAGNHNMRHSHLQKHGILFVKINLLLWVHQALKSPNVNVSSPGTEVSKCYCEFTRHWGLQMLLWVHRHWGLQMLLWVHQALKSPNVTVSSPGTEVSKCYCEFTRHWSLQMFPSLLSSSSLPLLIHSLRPPEFSSCRQP